MRVNKKHGNDRPALKTAYVVSVPLTWIACVLFFVYGTTTIHRGYGQIETNQEEPEEVRAAPSKPEKTPDQAERERRFEQMLNGAVLEGTWSWTGREGFSPERPLTEPQPEKYTIESVRKASAADFWIITARIQYQEQDVTVPVPVRVLWAGDTPVITVDSMMIPVVGTYSARVLIHEGFYSGVWYSGNKSYGGVLSGRVYKPEKEEVKEEDGNDE